MATIIAYLIAGISTTGFLILWFWVARRELQEKHNMVESAANQLATCHKEYMLSRDGQEAMDAERIFLRSRDIYLQSVNLYNETLKRPWYGIPGFLMGFQIVSAKET